MTGLPAVSLVILNYEGRRFLDRCLESALALDYPPDRLEVILVDNGSQDGSAAFVRRRFPGVTVRALDTNYGFAEANNRGAQSAKHEWVAFLNNDMWFRPSWLRDLVAPLERQPRLMCLTSKILNWNGSAIDFVGGGVNFEGHGFQIDHGLPVSACDRARRVIAPCGGAMAIRRELFLEVGGFDSDYFAFFEDTDLGWRLNLLGHDVWYTPDSVVYHAQHGTARRFRPDQLRVLYERNAMYTIYKCLDDANLAVALPMAMLLMNERALRIARVDPSRFQLASTPDRHLEDDAMGLGKTGRSRGLQFKRAQARRTVQQHGWATLARKTSRSAKQAAVSVLRRPLLRHGFFMPNLSVSHYIALHQFARSLGDLREKRQWVQSRRVRSDQDLMPLLVEPLRPSWHDPEYLDFHRWITRVAGLTERFGTGG